MVRYPLKASKIATETMLRWTLLNAAKWLVSGDQGLLMGEGYQGGSIFDSTNITDWEVTPLIHQPRFINPELTL